MQTHVSFEQLRSTHGILTLTRRVAPWSLLLLTFTAYGCGEARVPVHPVSGKVSFQGKAPSGARIALHTVSGGAEGVAPTGRVNEDGTFSITAYEPGDGAPAGDYVATIEWYKVVPDPAGGGAPGPNVLPKKYSSVQTSPIKLTVSNGPTQLEPITITN